MESFGEDRSVDDAALKTDGPGTLLNLDGLQVIEPAVISSSSAPVDAQKGAVYLHAPLMTRSVEAAAILRLR